MRGKELAYQSAVNGKANISHTHTISQITSLQSELNSLKTSVSNGKSAVASAITDKGVSTSATASFNTMADNIRKIPTSPAEISGKVPVAMFYRYMNSVRVTNTSSAAVAVIQNAFPTIANYVTDTDPTYFFMLYGNATANGASATDVKVFVPIGDTFKGTDPWNNSVDNYYSSFTPVFITKSTTIPKQIAQKTILSGNITYTLTISMFASGADIRMRLAVTPSTPTFSTYLVINLGIIVYSTGNNFPPSK